METSDVQNMQNAWQSTLLANSGSKSKVYGLVLIYKTLNHSTIFDGDVPIVEIRSVALKNTQINL